jgi:hypothetical protein
MWDLGRIYNVQMQDIKPFGKSANIDRCTNNVDVSTMCRKL